MTPHARTAEHDAFGPWIDIVRTTDEIPRLFRPHGADPLTSRLILKVPRDIPRRDTDPTMDLYDHLLVLRQDDMDVLSRDGSAFTARRIPYADVVAVRDSVDLLDGRLTLHLADGSRLDVRYNGASSEVVVDLVERLVALASTAGDPPDRGVSSAAPQRVPVTPRADLGREEAGVASAYWDLAARDPQLRFLSSCPRTPLRATATGAAGVLARLRPMSLAGTIAACTARELLIVTRRDQILRRRTATLSLDRLHILRHAITCTTAEPHPRFADMSTVTIRAGGAAFEIVAAATDALESDLLTVVG